MINFDHLNDKELKAALDEAVSDMEKASEECPNTEWHEACFAASVLLAQEYNRRKQ